MHIFSFRCKTETIGKDVYFTKLTENFQALSNTLSALYITEKYFKKYDF